MLLRKSVIKLAKEKFLKDYSFDYRFFDFRGAPFFISLCDLDQKSLSTFLKRFGDLCIYIGDSFILSGISLQIKDRKAEELIFYFKKKGWKSSCLKDFLIKHFWNLIDSFLLKNEEIFRFEVSKQVGVNGSFYRFFVCYNGVSRYNHVDLYLPDDPDLIFIASLLGVISCKRRMFLDSLKFSENKIKELSGLLCKKDLKELYVILEFFFDDIIKSN